MSNKVELSVKKTTKLMGWVFSILSFVLLATAVLMYGESPSEVEPIIWVCFGVLVLAAIYLPYLNKIRGVIITDKDITVNLLYKGKPIPMDQIEEVHFISTWGLPKKGRNVVNIDTRLDNRKQAAEFLEGKVKVTGAEKLK